MKIRDIKESKQINELDLSPFIGSYGNAKLDSMLGDAPGAADVEDRMAMDLFLKKFIGNASQAVNQAVKSGLVAQGATAPAQPQSTPAQATPAQAQSPEQIRKQKQAAAGAIAQQQMAANPAPAKATPAVAQTPAQIRQQKQAQAATAAQGQMTPKVAGPTPKTPEQIRQAKQLAATQAAQGQMAPASKLPAGQFNKSATNVRQQQQATATQTAQQQMAAPTKAPSTLDKPYDPTTGKGRKYDGVTGEPTPEWQKELDKQEAAREVEYQANRQKSQAAAAERDAQNAELVRQGARQNPSNVTNNITQTSTAPGNVKIANGDPAQVKTAMQAKIDAMKAKNPKLAAAMQAEIDNAFEKSSTAPKTNNPPGFNAQNVMNMPGMQKKDAPVTAESIRFDRLNSLFESIIREAEQQSISQYLMGFFKKFMVNVDPKALQTAMPKAEALAKEAEASYPKMNASLTKLAQLGWAVSHQEGSDEPKQSAPAGTTPAPGVTSPGTPPSAGPATSDPKQVQTVYAQVKGMLDKLDKQGKQRILAALQKSLGSAPSAPPSTKTAPKATNEPLSIGGQKINPNDPLYAKMQQQLAGK